ncbi:MAG TPA: large-conductance mechanosensitive channel protein MscL [Xanthomonadales bacterium]|nr:large-conductance mechanosensitive channel protein MscL [Xanthomonadales bacterium]
MGLFAEFKTFAMRGNVIDLAVGVVIGAAFGKIVSSLVDGVIMPLIGMVVGGVDFSKLALELEPRAVDAAGTITDPGVYLAYGAFLQTLLDFVIVAFAIFMFIKAINAMRRKEAEAPSTPPAPTAEETLLTEIRDLLKARPV